MRLARRPLWLGDRWLRALCLGLILCGASFGGCKHAPPEAEPAVIAPTIRRLRQNDRQTGALIRSWSVLVHPDGSSVKHGRDLRWYPNGARLSEAEFDHGEPTGSLRRWFANGQMQSESSFDPEGKLTPMTFWHENGVVAARGQGRSGRREGMWEHFFVNGKAREHGGYIDGQRTGLWTIYYADGSVKGLGRFENGARVGSWQHFEPGERLDAQK